MPARTEGSEPFSRSGSAEETVEGDSGRDFDSRMHIERGMQIGRYLVLSRIGAGGMGRDRVLSGNSAAVGARPIQTLGRALGSTR